MGFFDGLIGNASETSLEAVESEIKDLLTTSEHVEHAYKVIRDLFVFTNKRLILIDKQGVTGKKIEYHSIPYKNIVHFSVETAGNFDVDAEMKIWISAGGIIEKRFNKSLNIYKVQSVLAEYVLR